MICPVFIGQGLTLRSSWLTQTPIRDNMAACQTASACYVRSLHRLTEPPNPNVSIALVWELDCLRYKERCPTPEHRGRKLRWSH
jgi:hypothetical protein